VPQGTRGGVSWIRLIPLFTRHLCSAHNPLAKHGGSRLHTGITPCCISSGKGGRSRL